MAENDGLDMRPPSDIDHMSSAAAVQKLVEMKVEFDRANNAAPPAPLSSGASAQTPAQAAARLAQLQSDPAWVDKFLAGSGQQQREFAQLSEIAASGDEIPDGPFETVDAVSNPSALSRAAYAALMDGLREQGLPEKAEAHIRAVDAGLSDYAPTQGDGAAFKQALDRLLKDPAVGQRYLAGDVATVNQINNMNRVVALAAPDGQPVSAEGVEILTRLGLR
jgi:hypothetical protein